MFWTPNPTDWTPQPTEADLFHHVYIDESSQTKHRFLVIGGLIVASSHAKALEDAITTAREGTRQPGLCGEMAVHSPSSGPSVTNRPLRLAKKL
jgi:hypothetical protein